MTAPQGLKVSYLAALALPKGDVTSPSLNAQRAALARAHELRKFEIENYWKRATYFWAFQLAAFTLLGLLWRETVGPPPTLHENILMIPAGLGAITGLVGWMTSRGSKFWQENWECHVDMLETSLEGRLTQVVFNRGGMKYSVSRVNEKLLFVVSAGWFLLFAAIVFLPCVSRIPEVWQRILGVLALISTCAFVWEGAQSRLSGVSTDGSNWKRVENRSLRNNLRAVFKRNEPQTHLVLRDTMAGKAAVSDAEPLVEDDR